MRALVFLFALTLSAADFPFAGVWRIVPAKSKFALGEPPKTLMLRLTAVEGGFRYESRNLDNPQQPAGLSFVVQFDQGAVKAPSSRGSYDQVEAKRTGPQTFTMIYRKAGQTVGESRYSLKQGALIREGFLTRADGQTNRYTEHFEKSKP